MQDSPAPRGSFLGLGPDDVVSAVEGDEHEAGFLGFAGEPMHGFAVHHGEAAGPKSLFSHSFHAGEDIAADDDQLLLRDATASRTIIYGAIGINFLFVVLYMTLIFLLLILHALVG